MMPFDFPIPWAPGAIASQCTLMIRIKTTLLTRSPESVQLQATCAGREDCDWEVLWQTAAPFTAMDIHMACVLAFAV